VKNSIFSRPEIARNYRSTRYLPLTAAVALLTSVIRHARGPHVSVADVGCGVGRFATALRHVAADFSYTGVDASSAMLSQFNRTIRRDARYTLRLADASADTLRPVHARIVLAHWVANTTPRWQELLDSCVAIKGSEMVVWFDERSPLYDCVDGHATATALPPFFAAFVRVFFGALADEDTVRRRPGIHIHDRAVERYVVTRGFSRVDRLAPVTWTGSMSASFFFEYFLKPRAFTNLALLPSGRYARALVRAASMLGRFPRDANRLFPLSYVATPVLASRL
jgi:SAM-dependent methyltransferase